METESFEHSIIGCIRDDEDAHSRRSVYLSYDNMELVASLDGTPYIAFKSNTTADEDAGPYVPPLSA